LRVAAKQREAIEFLGRARDECPSTDDGVTTAEATFYDAEVSVAYVHWRTARALHRRGLVEWDDDGAIILTADWQPPLPGRAW
jgi:transposase